MAVLESDIAKTGGDYSTVAAWEADCPTLGSNIWKGRIIDAEDYDESVTIAVAGTPSITSYVWLTAEGSGDHGGVVGGGARIAYDGTSTDAILIQENFTRIDHLEVCRPSSAQVGNSDEAIRIEPGDNVLIDYCIIWSDDTNTDMDGIYVGNIDITNLSISNCIIFGWTRTGFTFQQFSNSPGRTQDATVDHCAFYDCNSDDDSSSAAAIFIYDRNTNDDQTVNIYNTWLHVDQANTTNQELISGALGNPGGAASGAVILWDGSHIVTVSNDFSRIDDAGETDSITDQIDAANGIDDEAKGSGAWILVTSIVGGSEDFLPLDDAGNVLLAAGTDRVGSEPDARQDFSVDITGGARGTTDVDIGPFQISGGAAAQSVTGAVLQVAPIFPTGTATPGAVTVAGALLSVAPVFPTATVTPTHTVVGVLLSIPPGFPTGVVTPGAVTVAGAVLQVSPSFPTGTATPGVATVAGVLLAVAPAFPTGTVAATHTVAGVLLGVSPVFPTGTATPGVATVAGALLQPTPSFPAGSAVATGGPQTLAGAAFSVSPSFPIGSLAAANTVAGALLQAGPAFPAGALAATHAVAGGLFVVSPSFPAGSLAAANAVAGVLLQAGPVFPTGDVTPGAATIAGALLLATPSFPIGSAVLAGAPQTSNGVLLSVAPSFPTGALAATATINGSLATVSPVFPAGSLAATHTTSGVLLSVSPVYPTATVTLGIPGGATWIEGGLAVGASSGSSIHMGVDAGLTAGTVDSGVTESQTTP